MLTLIKTLSDPATIKALIVPFSPALSRVMLILVGIAIGIAAVFLGLPFLGIQFRNAEPVHLTDGYKDQWVENAAVAYAFEVYENPDEQAAAALESAGYGPEELQALAAANAEASPAMQQALLAMVDLPSQEAANTQQGKITGGILDTIGPLLCLFGFGIIGIILGIVLSFRPIPVGKWRKGAIVGDERTAGLGEKERQRREALANMAGSAEDLTDELGEPIAKYMSAYVIGDDLYDDSFEIEFGENKEFLGECGIEISETIGVGDPKKVTAFEVWVFDQNEIQTLAKVVMSPHAYNDQSLRAKLAPRGEPVLAEKNKPIILETKTLKMQVRVVDLDYGEGSLPPNSFFDKVTYSLAVWRKDGSGNGGGGSSLPPMPAPTMPPAQQASMPSTPPPQATPQGGQPAPSYAPPPQAQQGGQPMTNNPPPQAQQGGQPLTSNVPPPQQPPPLTNNAPGRQPMTNNPPPQQPGGIRPLTSNAPTEQPPQQAAPPPAPGSAPWAPRQPRNVDDDDDQSQGRKAPPNNPFGGGGNPFGDTNS